MPPNNRPLPFDRTLLDRRDEILKAVWKLVEPAIGRTMSYTIWRQRNSAVATDLARCEVPVANVLRAWHAASNRLGEPVRMLRIVQDELSEAAAIVHGAKVRAQA